MKIGHYLEGLGIAGGIQSYVTRLTAAQREAGHEVIHFDRTVAERHVPGAVEVRTAAELIREAELRKLDILHLHNAIDSMPTRLRLVRTMHGHQPYCPSGGRYLKRPGVACNRPYSLVGCTWGHFANRCGSIRPAQFIDDFRRTRLEMRQLPQIHVLAISEFVRREMIRSGFPAERITTVYLPAPSVPAEPAPLPPGPPMFLFMGRIVENKGLEWVIRALAATREPVPLEVAGSGPQLDRMRALVAQLDLTARVTFHGWLREAQVFERINAARAIIFPSLWHEPAGLVTLEAAAHGRAIICSRVGGIPEYAAQLQNAMLVEPNDVTTLAQAIDQLAREPARAQELGRKGYIRARDELNMSLHLTRLEQIYRGQETSASSTPILVDRSQD